MKNEILKRTIQLLPLLFLLAIFNVSCSGDEAEQSADADQVEVESVEILAEIQSMTEVLDDMAEVLGTELDPALQFKESPEKSLSNEPYFSSCVSRTLVMEGNSINISLDFGSGCEGPHGNVLAGVIRIDLQMIDFDEQLVTHSFEDFSINGRGIEGSMTRNRIRSNDDGFPEVQTSKDLNIQWDKDTVFNRVGETTRVWIEGTDTRNWGDDVFVTTGNWNVSKNGVLRRSVTISKELRREMGCRFLVSGTMDIEGDAGTYTLDFGDGSCDNTAIVSSGDGEKEIQLGRFRKRIRN